jgi:hypothetical protein
VVLSACTARAAVASGLPAMFAAFARPSAFRRGLPGPLAGTLDYAIGLAVTMPAMGGYPHNSDKTNAVPRHAVNSAYFVVLP